MNESSPSEKQPIKIQIFNFYTVIAAKLNVTPDGQSILLSCKCGNAIQAE
jgi:hypothetical protein